MTIEELKQALEAATPLPWAFNCEEVDVYTTIRAGEFEVADAWLPANARLIVEAVNNLPALLKVAEAAENAVDGVRPCLGADLDALSKTLEELNNG